MLTLEQRVAEIEMALSQLSQGPDLRFANLYGTQGGRDTPSSLPQISACRVTHSIDQSIADDTDVILSFDTEREDSEAIHDNSTNNSRLTCKTAGRYLIIANVEWEISGTGYRRVDILLNGTTVIARDQRSATPGAAQQVTSEYSLAVGDYLQVRVHHTRTIAATILKGSAYSPEFMMARVG